MLHCGRIDGTTLLQPADAVCSPRMTSEKSGAVETWNKQALNKQTWNKQAFCKAIPAELSQ